MSAAQQLTAQWQTAALKLGIEFEGPFTMITPTGEEHQFAGRLPQFGAVRGLLLLAHYDARAVAEAAVLGFGYACLDPEPNAPDSDLSGYIECLRDWGWASSQERPSWF